MRECWFHYNLAACDVPVTALHLVSSPVRLYILHPCLYTTSVTTSYKEMLFWNKVDLSVSEFAALFISQVSESATSLRPVLTILPSTRKITIKGKKYKDGL